MDSRSGAVQLARLDDMKRFGRELVRSEDIDPVYPVLRALYANLGLDRRSETALWFTYLYVAYYNLPSAYAAWREVPEPDLGLIDLKRSKLSALPTGIERRGLRGGRVIPFLESSVRANEGQLFNYLASVEGNKYTPQQRFAFVFAVMESIPGNGRWAAYKWCDLMRNVHLYPLAAPDTGLSNGSGHKDGLEWVLDTPDADMQTLRQGEGKIGYALGRAISGVLAHTVGWEEVETILCNMNSLRKGKYYIGHDIDEMAGLIKAMMENRLITHNQFQDLWLARADSLPGPYRREDWREYGVDRERCKVYRDTGRIIARGYGGQNVYV